MDSSGSNSSKKKQQKRIAGELQSRKQNIAIAFDPNRTKLRTVTEAFGDSSSINQGGSSGHANGGKPLITPDNTAGVISNTFFRHANFSEEVSHVSSTKKNAKQGNQQVISDSVMLLSKLNQEEHKGKILNSSMCDNLPPIVPVD